MSKFEVVPYCYWRHKDGHTASIHSALPYMTEKDKEDWTIVKEGFTIYNPRTGQYGTGRAPFGSLEAAHLYADTHPAPAIGYGD